ncbi:hypothetical protein BC831DRAFT_541258, partial [Entophlyctis helioformis]
GQHQGHDQPASGCRKSSIPLQIRVIAQVFLVILTAVLGSCLIVLEGVAGARVGRRGKTHAVRPVHVHAYVHGCSNLALAERAAQPKVFVVRLQEQVVVVIVCQVALEIHVGVVTVRISATAGRLSIAVTVQVGRRAQAATGRRLSGIAWCRREHMIPLAHCRLTSRVSVGLVSEASIVQGLRILSLMGNEAVFWIGMVPSSGDAMLSGSGPQSALALDDLAADLEPDREAATVLDAVFPADLDAVPARDATGDDAATESTLADARAAAAAAAAAAAFPDPGGRAMERMRGRLRLGTSIMTHPVVLVVLHAESQYHFWVDVPSTTPAGIGTLQHCSWYARQQPSHWTRMLPARECGWKHDAHQSCKMGRRRSLTCSWAKAVRLRRGSFSMYP